MILFCLLFFSSLTYKIIFLANDSYVPCFFSFSALQIMIIFAALKLEFHVRKSYVSRPQKTLLRQQRYNLSSIPQKNEAGIFKKVGKILFKTSSDSNQNQFWSQGQKPLCSCQPWH